MMVRRGGAFFLKKILDPTLFDNGEKTSGKREYFLYTVARATGFDRNRFFFVFIIIIHSKNKS